MSNIHGNEYVEEEWWSVCCSAPPLYEVEELEDIMDTIGICMNCKEHVSFELVKEDSNEQSNVKNSIQRNK